MYKSNIVKTLVVLFVICIPNVLSAQLTYGVTGLLHAPSAEMQKDKTVMLGGNFMNKELTPPKWDYNTYNYYLNVTIMPWAEIAYTCTLFSAKALKFGDSNSRFINQDRYFSIRLRALKEGQFWKHMPAVVFGASDPFTQSGGGVVSSQLGNGYFCRFFAAATKHIQVGTETLGLHLSYLYNDRRDYSLNGVAGGVTYSPSVLPNLKLIADYDTKDIALGATYLLFNCLHLQVEMQRMKYFTGGLTYKIVLR